MSTKTVNLLVNFFLISISFPFISWVYFSFYSWKLTNYLKENDKYQYLWVYPFASLNPISDFLSMWSYLHSAEDEDDEIIANYKNKIRVGIKYFLISALLMFLFGFFVFVFVNTRNWHKKSADILEKNYACAVTSFIRILQ